MSTRRVGTENVNGYTVRLAEVDGVGEWDGQEEYVCDVIDSINRRIAELLPNNDGWDDGDDRVLDYETATKSVWDHWGSEDRLPDLAEDEIEAIAQQAVK